MPIDIKDLSGVASSSSSNPFDALINEANNDPKSIQRLYETHRTNRNAQQAQKLHSPDFQGMTLDPIFLQTIDPANEGKEVDHRHCLVFWARPPAPVCDLIAQIQEKLRIHAPNIWLMPLSCLHINVFEITHSRTADEISALESRLSPNASEICDWTFSHRARLVKPLLGHDASAVALTFVPAAGEGLTEQKDDGYSYHHLRRDIYDLSVSTGVEITSRYTVPSAHLTVARFVSQDDFVGTDGKIDPRTVKGWVDTLKEINEWLQREYWPGEDGIETGGEWVVGQEKGLDHRKGTLWYGGGETILLGKGF